MLSNNNVDRHLLLQNIIYFNQGSFTLQAFVLPSTLIRSLGLRTQAFQLDILITFVYTSYFNYLCK